MRALPFLLGCFCATALFAAGEQPKLDGNVGVVSSTDVGAIATAAKRWLQETPDLSRRTGDRLSLIHIVDRNKAEAHFGARDGKARGYFVETVVTVRRVKTQWKANDIAKVIGADSF